MNITIIIGFETINKKIGRMGWKGSRATKYLSDQCWPPQKAS